MEELEYQARDSVISATSMADYLIHILDMIHIDVHVISASKSNKKGVGYIKKYTTEKEGTRFTVSPAIYINGKLGNICKTLFLNIWLFFYLFFHSDKNEEILVYHGLNKIPALLVAKKIKKLRYCLYVGEVYHNISEHTAMQAKLEDIMLKNADKYIFATDELKNIIGVNNKKSIVISGILSPVPRYEEKFEDDKIHIVYAGIINENKGALLACELARYLDDGYQVHIAGYGEENSVKLLRKRILEIQKVSLCKITYEGLLQGSDYYKFLQKCHIGLCPQITDDKYNNSSFPSKISVYLANNLRVLAPDVPAIKNNILGKALYYYDDANPVAIAELIKSINYKEAYSSRNMIENAHQSAIDGIRGLFYEHENSI